MKTIPIISDVTRRAAPVAREDDIMKEMNRDH